MPKLLLGGYLGAGNLGDDAVMHGLVQAVGPGYDITVLSAHPDQTHSRYGLSAVPRRDRGAVKAAIRECDALVYPGGSVFQDTTSAKSVLYYSEQVKMAKKLGKKVALVGQGVGPLTRYFGKRWAREAFSLADAVTVRDVESKKLLETMGIKNVRLAGDSAFLLPEPPGLGELEAFGVSGLPPVALAPRPHGKADIAGLFAEICKSLFQLRRMPVLIAMDAPNDEPLVHEISQRAGGKVPDMRKLKTPAEVQSRIARMDGLIAMRLHAGILASTVGVPPLMLSYDPKVMAFARGLDVGPALSMEGLTPARVIDAFLGAEKRREALVPVLKKRTAAMREAAQVSVDAIHRLLPPS